MLEHNKDVCHKKAEDQQEDGKCNAFRHTPGELDLPQLVLHEIDHEQRHLIGSQSN